MSAEKQEQNPPAYEKSKSPRRHNRLYGAITDIGSLTTMLGGKIAGNDIQHPFHQGDIRTGGLIFGAGYLIHLLNPQTTETSIHRAIFGASAGLAVALNQPNNLTELTFDGGIIATTLIINRLSRTKEQDMLPRSGNIFTRVRNKLASRKIPTKNQ